MIAALTKDGHLTLPREVRRRLGVDQGGQIELEIEGDGSVRLRPAPSAGQVNDYLSLCHGVYKGLSDQDIDDVEKVVLDRSNFRTRAIDV